MGRKCSGLKRSKTVRMFRLKPQIEIPLSEVMGLYTAEKFKMTNSKSLSKNEKPNIESSIHQYLIYNHMSRHHTQRAKSRLYFFVTVTCYISHCLDKINKIEGTAILKLALVKRLKIKKNLQKNQNSSKNLSKKFVKKNRKIRQNKEPLKC